MTTPTHEPATAPLRVRRYLCDRCSLRHTPVCPAPLWPLAPLLEGVSHPAEMFSASASQLASYAADGLPDHVADRWALRRGRMPWDIWPGWFDAGLTVVDRAFVEGGWRPAWEHHEPDAQVEAVAA